MEVHLFAMCLDEERMIPYFLTHYAGLVTKFHIFDNGSTDGSLRLLAGDPSIVVQPFRTGPDGFALTSQRLMEQVWQRSRDADWVITAEMDEHLHHPDLPAYLRWCATEGVTAIRAVGFDMLSEHYPASPAPLYRQVVRGVRTLGYDKMALFDPSAIVSTGYDPGRHTAKPTGRVVWERFRQVKLLHYKHLGQDHVSARNARLAQGLTAADDKAGWGRHYRVDARTLDRAWQGLQRRARRVPGLSDPGSPADEPTYRTELVLIERSGLFDAGYYIRHNRDLFPGWHGTPLDHFCTHGWPEGRRPNPLFDPAWYVAAYGLNGPGRSNPLLDYLLAGEAAGRRPCAAFDPALYRDLHDLPPGTPILAHALNHRWPGPLTVSAAQVEGERGH